MRNILENFKTLIVELIGLIGGFFWARNSNWDDEPIILMAASFVGIVAFIILRFVPAHDDKPIVDLEFIDGGSSRSAPQVIANMSPQDPDGSYLIQEGGTYLFRVERNYKLILRNNSQNVAYNLTLYKINLNHPITFENKYNPLDPLRIESPKTISLTYEVNRPMTHNDAYQLQHAPIPNDLNNFSILAKYQSGRRKTYYTRFTPLNSNEHFNKFPSLNLYSAI